MLFQIFTNDAPSPASITKMSLNDLANSFPRKAKRPNFAAAAPAPAATNAVSPYWAILSPAFHSEYELPGLNEKPLITACSATFETDSLSGVSTRTAETNPLRPRRLILHVLPRCPASLL